MTCSGKLADACNELASLARAPLPCARPGSRGWQALALRRDLRALQADMPAHGLSEVPAQLSLYKSFDKAILLAMRELDRVAAAAARHLPSNALYGPWEGGLAVDEAEPSASNRAVFPLRIFSWNIRGAFGSAGGTESHTGRILETVKLLFDKGASIAVFSEPRFAQGMVWPSWTNFDFHGARSSQSDTVAVLVLSELDKLVVPISDIGDERAIWLEVRLEDESDGILLLATYAPPSSRPGYERIEFFQRRCAELLSLRS